MNESRSAAEAARPWGFGRYVLPTLFIVGYLSTLAFGVGAHTLKWGQSSHPLMYFIVWDMFCGWSAWDVRYEVIGQGESGQYYELAPSPWGQVRTHGRLGRQHYDLDGVYSCRIALNTLEHTDHEAIERIFVVERAYAKKYNVAEKHWARRYAEPRAPHFYHQVRHVLTGEGRLVKTQPSFSSVMKTRAIAGSGRIRHAPNLRPLLALSHTSERQRDRYSAALPVMH